ncbi:MAG: NAD-dependent epimerase/dehydratase family protein [Ilumatobacter sp.]|nr:NAD-dependent epimerase/dehydratase family protein [Ilumatobacter sp.]
MHVVVIGGAGFIGSHLVDRLLASEHSVDVIDDLSNGSLANLADARRAGGVKIHHLDGSSSEAASLLGMRRPDVVYHLGLFPRCERPAAAVAGALTAALATLEACRAHGVGKVVVALPAAALYGHPPVSALPVKEGATASRGVRGVAAGAVLDLLGHYREQENLEFTALALASVYGPRQRADGGVVAALHHAFVDGMTPTIHGDGRQTRDFVYIDDVVDALVRAADRSTGLLINIGTGHQTSIRDLWSELSGGTDAITGPGRRDELHRFAVSPVRARIHLGWSPWTELHEGLRRLGEHPSTSAG